MGTVHFVYVYAWSKSEYENSDYVLVGEFPTIDGVPYDEKAFSKTLYGWCRTSKVFRWNSRIALIPNPDTQHPSHVFSSHPALKRFYEGAEMIAKPEPAKLLFPDTLKSWQPGNWPFFLHRRFDQALSMNCLVGVQGANIEEKKRELEDLKYHSKNVDVVFLIDATKSMAPYIRGVSNLIKKVMQKLNTNNYIQRIRFGAAVYRDYVDGERKFEIKPLETNIREVQDWLYRMSLMASSHTRDSGEASWPEALFNGIQQAVNQSGFGRYNSKFLVVIGDTGNHSRGHDKHTSGSIGETLAANTINCIMVKVNHPIKGGASEKDAMELFRTHAREIRINYIKYHNRKSYGYRFPRESMAKLFKFDEVDSPSKLSGKLIEDYTNSISDSVDSMIQDYQNCINGVSIIETSGEFLINPIVMQNLKRRFSGNFERILKELQESRAYIMNFGYAIEYDPRTPKINQFKNVYLFRKNEILGIVKNLQMALHALRRNYIHHLWKDLIRDVYGESYNPRKTFNDYAKMRDGIPYKNLSDLFDKTQQQILALTREEINRIRQRVYETQNRLNELLLDESNKRFFGPKDDPYIWLYDYELP
jgi:hypothetical protein